MSEQDEIVQQEAIISDDSQVIENELDGIEDVEALKEHAKAKEDFARQATARAKTVEAENRKLKEELKQFSTQPTQNINKALSVEDMELAILRAKGIDAQLLEDMRALAKVRGKSVLDIEKDPIIVAMKSEQEAKAKAEKAKLGASRGSGQVKEEKQINTSGLTDAEHKALWKQMNG